MVEEEKALASAYDIVLNMKLSILRLRLFHMNNAPR